MKQVYESVQCNIITVCLITQVLLNSKFESLNSTQSRRMNLGLQQFQSTEWSNVFPHSVFKRKIYIWLTEDSTNGTELCKSCKEFYNRASFST